MNRAIPLAKPDIGEREIKYVTQVLKSGTLSIGPVIEKFEQKFIEKLGVRNAVAVNSGTSALHLLVRAYDISDGDEVITTSFSFISSTNCVLFERAKPVFVDIDPRTYNLDISQIESKITARTKAILPVDVFGQPFDIDAVNDIARRYNLKVIQDSCEALGSCWKGKPVGSQADAAVFSFYPNKQVTTAEGGMIVTDDDEIAEQCRSMRSQGRSLTETWLHHSRLGYNYRLSELHAALGLAQMERLDELIAAREQVAELYNSALRDTKGITVPWIDPGVSKMSWFVYVLLLDENTCRDAVLEGLQRQKIECKPYFTAIHLQPYIQELTGYGPGSLPVTESIASRTLAIPFFPSLTEEDINTVVEAIKDQLVKCR